MSRRGMQMHVGEMINLLSKYDPELTLVLCVDVEEGAVVPNKTMTFVVDPKVGIELAEPTYLGDMAVLRLDWEQDEP